MEWICHPGEWFYPPEDMTSNWQLLWTFLTYGYVLFMAANMIGDGSELLLLIPSLAGLVGSVVLPVLGAVPDGMMVLFSGLGDLGTAQKQVAVGVGALAGSTIMLLTIPWFLAIFGGRVDIKQGKCKYSRPKLTRSIVSLNSTGIEFDQQVRNNAVIMLFTSLTYFVVQLPAMFVDNQQSVGTSIPTSSMLKEIRKESSFVHFFSLAGMLICIVEFFVYLYLQYLNGKSQCTGSGSLPYLQGGLGQQMAASPGNIAVIAQNYSLMLFLQELRKDYQIDSKSNSQSGRRFLNAELPMTLKSVLSQFFLKYCEKRKEGAVITQKGFSKVIHDVGLQCDDKVMSQMFRKADKDNSHFIDKEEFFQLIKELAVNIDKDNPNSGCVSSDAAGVCVAPEKSKAMLPQTPGPYLPPLEAASPRTNAQIVQNRTLMQFLEKLRMDYQLGQSATQESRRQKLMDEDLPTLDKSIIHQFFLKYCRLLNGRVVVYGDSLEHVFFDAGFQYDATLVSDIAENQDNNVFIDRSNFLQLVKVLAARAPTILADSSSQLPRNSIANAALDVVNDGDEEDEEEEEEEMPEEFKDLPPDVQRRRILMKSFWTMGLGTLLVLIFSDPMVDVLNEMGNRSHVPTFYISFVLAPLASNASELVAAYKYASKKSRKTITISLNTLEGAACMNNTFCLAIFYALIFMQGLAWKFTAETMSIILVQFVVAVVVLCKRQQTLMTGLSLLLLFPSALIFVYILEHVGID